MKFRDWMALKEPRPEAVPDAPRLAFLIARSGAGMSRDDLRRLVSLSPDTLDDLLRALVTAGQVRMLQVTGQRVFRATT